MATYSFHWLTVGKWQVLLPHCRYLEFFFVQKCFLSSPLWFIWILSKLLNLIGCHDNIKGKFLKNYSKIFSSEAIRGMKLKLSTHVHDISVYINFVSYYRCPCGFVAMATWSFHRLIMGKVEIGIYFCVTADILTKDLQKCSLPTIWILSVTDFAMATKRLNFRKKIFKNLLLRSHKGDEAKTLHKWSWH